MQPRIDYTGKKFGHLTMLHFSRGRGAGKCAMWMAVCDCGTVKEIPGKEASRGTIKTCGKCQYWRKLMSDSSGKRKYIRNPQGLSLKAHERWLFSRYLKSANEREYEFNLTPEQLIELSKQNCTYCGIEPAQTLKNSRWKYNGIDRIDNRKGYTLDNCTSCCSTCNRMKWKSNSVDFLEKVMRIYHHVRHTILTEQSPIDNPK